MTDWFGLKSGSDIRGTAIATEHTEVNLTDEVVRGVVTGFYAWIRKSVTKSNLTIAVGCDSRISGPRMKEAVISTLCSYGVTVLDCGLCSTPAMFMITVDEAQNCDASVQITASHHPFDKNGLKFFTRAGGLESGDITEILQYASEGICFSAKEGSVKTCDYLSVYSKTLVDFVRERTGEKQPLKGCKIVVDAGNGAGGFYVDKVLKPLGANTAGSQFLEPDGRFPNHVPNPENKQAMQSVCSAVKKAKANFGIIFDTDVDRAGAVGSDGSEINRNRLIALISAILLAEHSPATIVTDSVTSDGLKTFIEAHGGIHRRFKRGYKNVINECKRLNDEGVYSPLAIETSGHAALKENYYLDDGAYLVTRLLVQLAACKKAGKDICDLIADLPLPAEEAEIRLKFGVHDFVPYGKRIIDQLTLLAKKDENLVLAEDNFEGVRIGFREQRGFALVRISVHDPIMPINIESDKKGGVKEIANRLYDMLAEFECLVREPLKTVNL